MKRFSFLGICTLILPLAFCVRWKSQHRALHQRQKINFQLSSPATSTREINAFCLDENGALWAATNGGVMRRTPDGTWTKWTRADGLPSNEVRAIRFINNRVRIQTPRGARSYATNQWKASPDFSDSKTIVTWNDARVSTNGQGLRIVGKSSTRIVPTPGNGTHISALWPHGKTILAASFGDNIYEWNGKRWRALNLILPTEARDITALCEDATGKNLWIGTRRAGVWRCDLTTRKAVASSSHELEPIDHNVQNMASFGGRLWLSTLEDGLTSFDGKSWQTATFPQISSVAPRQMTVFNHALYVRHGDGQVDKWDGKSWAKDVFAQLPRHKVFALASDESRLIAVQYGGWSEWDGATWTHHFDVAELQNAPLVSVLLDDQTLWLGTQNRGLIEYSMAQKTVRVHDERNGLSDDWVTTIGKVGDQIYAGTFVGGLARYDGEKWTTQPELKGENVTAIEPDIKDNAQKSRAAFVATRHGVWKVQNDGTVQKMADEKTDSEAQALLQASGGLWVGTRTGLYFVRNSTGE